MRDLAGRPAEIDAADLEPDLNASPKVGAAAALPRRRASTVVIMSSRGLGGPVVAFAGGKAQIMRTAHRRRRSRCASRPWSSSPASADRPSETACNPAASGARSGRAVSAPRTIDGEPRQRRLALQAEQLQHGVETAALALVASSTPSMSNGTPPVSRATAGTSGGSTNRNLASPIEEAADQPRAGDAVDLRPPPRHPKAWPPTQQQRSSAARATSGRPAVAYHAA